MGGMRLPMLVCLFTGLSLGQDLMFLHFAGWHSNHPDLVKMAEATTRQEFERSSGLAMLSVAAAEQLQRKGDLARVPPEPPTALQMARACGRPNVVWARLDVFENRFERKWYKPLWPRRIWTMEADFFAYDSVKRALRRERVTAADTVYLGFTGLAGKDMLVPPENERFRASQRLLRSLSVRMRVLLEEKRLLTAAGDPDVLVP